MRGDNQNSFGLIFSVFGTFIVIFGFGFFVWKIRARHSVKAKYTIIFNNASAYGISEGSPIFFRGFNIGSVKKMNFINGDIIMDAEIYHSNFPINVSTEISSQVLDIGGTHGLFFVTPNLDAAPKKDYIFYASFSNIEKLNILFDTLLTDIKLNHIPIKFDDIFINLNELILLLSETIKITNITLSKDLKKLIHSLLIVSNKIKNSTILNL